MRWMRLPPPSSKRVFACLKCTKDKKCAEQRCNTVVRHILRLKSLCFFVRAAECEFHSRIKYEITNKTGKQYK